jgi:hypothetical protein
MAGHVGVAADMLLHIVSPARDVVTGLRLTGQRLQENRAVSIRSWGIFPMPSNSDDISWMSSMRSLSNLRVDRSDRLLASDAEQSRLLR